MQLILPEHFWKAAHSEHTSLKFMSRRYRTMHRLFLKNQSYTYSSSSLSPQFRLMPHALMTRTHFDAIPYVFGLPCFLGVCGVSFPFPIRNSSRSLQLVLIQCRLKHEESVVFVDFGQKPQSKHLYPLQAPGALVSCQAAQRMPPAILGLKCPNASSFSTSIRGMAQLQPVLIHKNKQLQLCIRPVPSHTFFMQQIIWEEFYGGVNANNCFQFSFKTPFWKHPFHGIQSNGLFSNQQLLVFVVRLVVFFSFKMKFLCSKSINSCMKRFLIINFASIAN